MSNDLQTRRALRFLVKLWGATVLVTGAASVAVYLIHSSGEIGNPRRHVADFLQKNGFSVRESDIVIAGGLGSRWRDSERPVVFLGAHSLGRRLDLWVAHMRLSPAGIPLKAKLQNISSTFFFNEKKAAVSPSWAFWEDAQPGVYHLAWLPDVRWRLRLHVHPAPEAANLSFDGDFAVLEGIADSRPVHVRVHPETRRVEAGGAQADLTVSFTAP